MMTSVNEVYGKDPNDARQRRCFVPGNNPIAKPSRILRRAEECFHERLEAKTNWGRNEVKQMFRDAMNEALMEALDNG